MARWGPQFLLAAAVAGVVLVDVGCSFAQATAVLGVAAEGVVVDAGQLPNLQPGVRFSFRRADGSTTEIAQGFVLDVRDGRALVGLKPGGSIQAGDIAIACATLSGPGSQADLRANVQALKAQLAATGGGSPDAQVAVAQLESTLDGRENEIRNGACDVSQYDRDIAMQSAQLQQLVASAPSGAAGGPPPSSAAPVPPPPLPGAVPGPPPSAPGATASAPPPPPTDPTQGGAPSPAGGFSGIADLLQKLFQMAQSMGGGGGGGKGSSSTTDQSSPSVAAAPTDGGSGPAQAPPVSAAPVLPPPSFGSSDAGSGTLPSGGGQPPTTGSQPPALGNQPPPGVTPPPTTGTQPPVTAQPPTITPQPPGARPPALGPSTPPPGGTSWRTVPLQPLPLPTPPPATVTPVPGIKSPPPGATVPPITSVVRVPPGEVNRPATVHGTLKDERGRPVTGAVVLIGGKHVETSHTIGQEGFFVVAGVPSGRQPLMVTKDGFVPLRQFVELKGGAVEKLSLTMQRSAPPPPPSFQHRPIAPRSGGAHQGP